MRLAASAVEETLGRDPPVQRTIRAPMTDVELAGVMVRGSMAVHYPVGANRDPAAYDDPNRFDITRMGGAAHLAFSSGIHYCL
jgi:cytochrome P450